MIKAIIFDCFGVLVQEGWKPFRDNYFPVSTERDWANEQMTLVSRGQLEPPKFIESIAARSGVTEQDLEKVLHDTPVDERMFELIKDLRKKYKIGLLSNVGPDIIENIFDEDQLGAFDSVALSYHLEVAKPSEEIYRHIASDLGVLAVECVFIDDTKRYCTGAEQVGMQSILFQDFEQFKVELEQLLAQN